MTDDGSVTPQGTPNPEAPNPQLAIAQKLRLRYAKRGRLRFTSHRDFGRAFERAVRRAGVPIAFSSGYTPHPKISYAGASPTGAASEAEFLEIGLTRPCEAEQVRAALDDSLPQGLDVLEAVVSAGGTLADRLEASRWEIELPIVSPSRLEDAVEALLAAEVVEVEKKTKRGPKMVDVRGPVVGLRVADMAPDESACAILALVVRHATPSIRPDDVLAGLRSQGGLEFDGTPLATRTAQGPLDEQNGTVGDPLALDRDAPDRC
ncbi:TIGR03936 family radical SAM-associated protein [Aeromicrobium sp. CTD01-1L150]|uniref:TIGR03936 family radical SAM-associated protein n=1 Tax=Aeromicrobium sp. CTD01-1L150 TaxID=3341830 RepID=UPI0035C06C2D